MLTIGRYLLLCLTLLVGFVLEKTNCDGLSVDPITTYLVDKSGRFRFYHGVNSVYK